MSPILGRMRAFLAQTRKDPFVAFLLRLQPGLWTLRLRTMCDGVESCSSWYFPSAPLFGQLSTRAYEWRPWKHAKLWGSERQFKHANRVMNMIIRNGVSNVLCGDGSILRGIHNDTARLPPVIAEKKQPSYFCSPAPDEISNYCVTSVMCKQICCWVLYAQLFLFPLSI